MKSILASSSVRLALALSLSTSCVADDWPMLGRDASRNSVSPEQNPPTDWDVGYIDKKMTRRDPSKSRHVKWAAQLGSIACGDPVVADGLVWVGTNNSPRFRRFDRDADASVLACYRESDGQLLYRYVSPRLKPQIWDWPNASLANSPLIEGDRAWFITNRGEVVNLDIGPLISGTGEPKVVWKRDMMQEFGVSLAAAIMHYTRYASVAGYRDRLYVVTGNGARFQGSNDGSRPDGLVPAPMAPSLVCFDKQSGRTLWTDNSPGSNILHGQWASPLVAEIEGRVQVITPQGDGWIRSFDGLTGELIWKFDINYKTSTWKAWYGTRMAFLATPVLYQGRVYIGGGQHEQLGGGRGRLCCIDPTKEGDISLELAVDSEGRILEHRLPQAVDPALGKKAIPNPNSGLLWEFSGEDMNNDGELDFEEELHWVAASVSIDKGLVIAADQEGAVHCLDATTGRLNWSYDAFSSIVGAPLIIAGKIYIAGTDGYINMFNLSADPNLATKKIEGRFAPTNAYIVEGDVRIHHVIGTTYTAPIFANGTLYLTDHSHLFAIKTGAKETLHEYELDAETATNTIPGSSKPLSGKRQRTLSRSSFDPTPQQVVVTMLSAADPKTRRDGLRSRQRRRPNRDHRSQRIRLSSTRIRT